ncbi:hypothetical protein [Priestia koreensis]|uniref:hypothetical protein n=1 Tax=Priestia koreensis TaxID=284581 RepID=UPI001F561F63|nr:hypothetical protein [Priestia koreensis]UNL83567.1 hypothetical protein IE339_15530 [Priestia koreensis]
MSKRNKILWGAFCCVILLVAAGWVYRTDFFPWSYHSSKYNGSFLIPNHAVLVKEYKKDKVEIYRWGPKEMETNGIPARYKAALTKAGWKYEKMEGENTIFKKGKETVWIHGYTNKEEDGRTIAISP